MLERLRLWFDVFSRRRAGEQHSSDRVPETLRSRILMMCNDVFSGAMASPYSMARGDYTREFWREIHHSLRMATGRLQLNDQLRGSELEDTVHYLRTCRPEQFLDFMELIFRVDCLFHVALDGSEVVDAVNEVFRVEGTPYQLTPFVRVEEPATGRFAGHTAIRTVGYPKVIRVDEEATYEHAVLPALTVLADPAFTAASSEFRAALEDYRKGDFGDCLTKCGSAFESVMKVICIKNGWPITPKDTASTLLKTIRENSRLEGFLEQPLTVIATIRNRLSTAHGGGPGIRQAESPIAEYTVACTAAAIVLLVRELT